MKKLLIFLIVLLFIACSKNPLKIDVSKVTVDLKVKQFHHDLKSFGNGDSLANIQSLKKKYGEFFDIFTYHMISIGGLDQPNFLSLLNSFVNDTLIQTLEKKVDQIIDKTDLQEELNEAFKHYRYYFPDKKIPEVITCISGFNQSVVTADSVIGISLDKYLGANSRYYMQLGLPAYKRRNMQPGKILPDVMLAWAITEWPKSEQTNNLLSQMIHEGKLMYFVDAMLPDLPDSTKIGFTQNQLEFCKNTELSMWTYLAEQRLLYATERMDIKRFIDDGPYTPAFTDQSPARTGIWIGWQIVRSYMNTNKNIKLSDLMNNEDYQTILQQSGYQP
jgi:gliding motility-associated lipoprotein GldB